EPGVKAAASLPFRNHCPVEPEAFPPLLFPGKHKMDKPARSAPGGGLPVGEGVRRSQPDHKPLFSIPLDGSLTDHKIEALAGFGKRHDTGWPKADGRCRLNPCLDGEFAGGPAGLEDLRRGTPRDEVTLFSEANSAAGQPFERFRSRAGENEIERFATA